MLILLPLLLIFAAVAIIHFIFYKENDHCYFNIAIITVLIIFTNMSIILHYCPLSILPPLRHSLNQHSHRHYNSNLLLSFLHLLIRTLLLIYMKVITLIIYNLH